MSQSRVAFNDDPFLSVAARSAHIAEARRDRPAYDEQSPATMVHPNGSKVCSYDRAFCTAALAVMYAAWRKHIEAAA